MSLNPDPVSCGPDADGFVVLQESPRGGEDHAVRHGPGFIEDARRHRLSGPKHQVRKKKIKDGLITRNDQLINDSNASVGYFLLFFLGCTTWKLVS